jgi:hypothetical protein
MGFYLMNQVMMLMLAMMVGMITLVVGLFLPTFQILGLDLVYILLIVDLVFVLLGALMQFAQVVPILMKTMQGGPFHSSHITNLLVTLFLLIGLVLYYAELAIL